MVAAGSRRRRIDHGTAHVVGSAVIDGSGRDPSDLDVTIGNDRITRLGSSGVHGERVDAEGPAMTPGPIDAHVSDPNNAGLVILAGHIAKDLR
ncbi:hypothetical protein ABT001_02615 [Streptomyces sp. NPDC002793]|uniref:hypothetical protein n=1 Tax=Streptomyces sp. NPDC002793 TaxID=3154432 RepID=UPI003323F36D